MAGVQLVITMDEKGQIMVNGPVENKILCLGLLEFGKIAVINHVPSPIIKPELVPPMHQ